MPKGQAANSQCI